MTETVQHSLKHRIEYAFFWFFGVVFSILPYRAALALGWGVAWIGHYVMRYRVNLVYSRIREVFPEMPPRRVRQVAWLSWRNVVFNIVDMFRLSRVNETWLRRHMVDYDYTVDRVRESLAKEGGSVGVSLHMGSAEVSAVSLQLMGFKVFIIARQQKNRLVDENLNATRSQTGIDSIPNSAGFGMLKQVLRRLQQGGVLAMLADLRLPSGGVEVNFLGGRASVVPGAGYFAKKCGVPVVPSIITREGWVRHHLQVYAPIFADDNLSTEVDIQRITQSVFDLFDRAIRERPEQWFWYNKNWVLAPVRQKPGGALPSVTGAEL